MAVVESGSPEVQRVLGKGPIPDPFPTLDLARHDPDRLLARRPDSPGA